MAALAFLTLYVLMSAVPATVITAVIALLLRPLPWFRKGGALRVAAAGSLVPMAMAIRGLWLAWPWPWRQPDALYDMIPPGPGLLFSAVPAWLLSLGVSRIILRPHASRARERQSTQSSPMSR